MASENPEAQEAAFKNKQKQEEERGGGETNNLPVQEKEATAKQGFSNLPAVVLFDLGMENYHLLRLPAGGQIHPMNNKPVSRKDGLLIGSVEGGWLIIYRFFPRQQVVVSGYEDELLCYNYIYLLNPLSGVKLSLPPEPCFVDRQDFELRFVADVITSNCSPDSPEFFAVAFFLNCDVHWLAFCRIEDESWTHIAEIEHVPDDSIIIQPALALDDKIKLLYFVHLNPSASNYDVMVFDLKDSKNIKMKRLMMAESNILPREGIFSQAMKKDDKPVITNISIGDRRLYLVADSSCGDLFMVLQKNDVDSNSNILPVKSYRVFIKLDEGGPQWKEIHDMGDRSIFISHFNSRLISTAELNIGSKPEEEFIRGNCIYFALQSVNDTETISLKRDIGVFSLTDRSIKHFRLPSLFLKNPTLTLWFTPGSA